MFDLFLQFFPACLLFCTVAMIVTEDWAKFDRWVRRKLVGRALVVGDRVRVMEKEPECDDYTVVCDIEISTYFDELPNCRRF